ncbi:MAG: LysR substrate-binding domain-containing protein, partial [Paracoccaceae bacterium]
FEAAARHLSFKAAAEEARITPAAVSQRMRQLEEQLGRPLFRRMVRQVVLTADGQLLAARLKAPLAGIEAALAAFAAEPAERPLVLSTSATFAHQCLFPVLTRYHSSHPAQRVNVLVNDALADFSRDGVDIAVRQGLGRYPGAEAALLFAGRYVVVAAPDLLAADGAGTAPVPLIHAIWPDHFADAPIWPRWIARYGLLAPQGRDIMVSYESMAIQAALAGQGLALVHQAYVAADLARGALVLPYGPGAVLPTSVGHYLVRARGPLSPPLQGLWRWMIDSFAESGGSPPTAAAP